MSRVENPNILVADDNEATSTLITAVLHRDFNVDVASDGQEAIDRLRTRKYSALLLDLRMPQVDGFEVLEHLRQHQPKMLDSVIIVTGALSQRELQWASSYGICGIVTKPFEIDALVAAVKKCVSPEERSALGPVICSSGTVIWLLADLLRTRLM